MSETNGFVHIVESPASADLLDGRTEGRVLSEALQLAEIPFCYSLAVDTSMLLEAIGPRLGSAWKRFGRLPIVHLSMHGNTDGVELTSKEFISWQDLRRVLLPLMGAMRGGLLVCMSSCFGGAGCRMAMCGDDEPLFWALVGHSASPTWADAAIAYVSFYHLFFKGSPLSACVDAMKVASGDDRFTWFSGAKTRAEWNAFIQMNEQAIQQRLPAVAANRTSAL